MKTLGFLNIPLDISIKALFYPISDYKKLGYSGAAINVSKGEIRKTDNKPENWPDDVFIGKRFAHSSWDGEDCHVIEVYLGRGYFKIISKTKILNEVEIIAKIKSLLGNVRGVYKPIVAKPDIDVRRFAFEIAQQVSDPSSRGDAEKAVGIEIVELALKLFPNVKLNDEYKQ